jgi:acyl-CoA synthetase (AMP-forming)/AMP-acid ligase II
LGRLPLYIADRKKNMMISDGSNLYPCEIQEVICRHPAVFEVSVIGVPDDRWARR